MLICWCFQAPFYWLYCIPDSLRQRKYFLCCGLCCDITQVVAGHWPFFMNTTVLKPLIFLVMLCYEICARIPKVLCNKKYNYYYFPILTQHTGFLKVNTLYVVYKWNRLCSMLKHFKITHFRVVITVLWNLDIFSQGYHTVRISGQPMPRTQDYVGIPCLLKHTSLLGNTSKEISWRKAWNADNFRAF